MQRLFSNFAAGWQGLGLLLQRTFTAALLIRLGTVDPAGTSVSSSMIPQIVGGCAGVLFLLGLFTPVVGTLIAIVGLWVAITHIADPWISIAVATLGGTAAMIGPGAW